MKHVYCTFIFMHAFATLTSSYMWYLKCVICNFRPRLESDDCSPDEIYRLCFTYYLPFAKIEQHSSVVGRKSFIKSVKKDSVLRLRFLVALRYPLRQ